MSCEDDVVLVERSLAEPITAHPGIAAESTSVPILIFIQPIRGLSLAI